MSSLLFTTPPLIISVARKKRRNFSSLVLSNIKLGNYKAFLWKLYAKLLQNFSSRKWENRQQKIFHAMFYLYAKEHSISHNWNEVEYKFPFQNYQKHCWQFRFRKFRCRCRSAFSRDRKNVFKVLSRERFDFYVLLFPPPTLPITQFPETQHFASICAIDFHFNRCDVDRPRDEKDLALEQPV